MTAQAAARPAETGGFTKSLVFHAALIGGMVGWDWWQSRSGPTFGDPKSLGTAAGITSVSQIPIPKPPSRLNRVADDSDSEVPTPTKPQPKPQVEKEDPNAIALKRDKKKPQQQVASNRKYLEDPPLPNQIQSNLGRAASSPLYGVKGSGGVGVGDNSPFGDRFGWYGKLIQERIGQKWRTNDVDAGLRKAPRVIVTFSIARNGTVSNIRVVQSSGNYSLDNSVQRALFEVSPLPPLPDQFDRSTANCEFQFELSR